MTSFKMYPIVYLSLSYILHGQESSAGSRNGAPEVSHTRHMLRRILEHAITHVVFFLGVDGQGLKPSPPDGQNDWISTLQYFTVPTVLLNASLGVGVVNRN